MNPKVADIARVLIALAFVGFAALQFIYGEFIVGRPRTWPEWLQGRVEFAYLSGVVFFLFGISILLKKWVVITSITAGAIVLLGSALPNLINLISTMSYGAILTATGKALTLGGGALFTAFVARREKSISRVTDFLSMSVPLERYFIGFFLLASGIQHFLFINFVVFLMPSWIPFHKFWAYFAGVVLCAAGLGLLSGIRTRLASTLAGWMIFSWVILLHIPRALVADDKAVQNEWTAVFEATAFSGILFALAFALNKKASE